MATQTGSIDLTATNAVKLFADAGFTTAGETYATKSELTLEADGIRTSVSETYATQTSLNSEITKRKAAYGTCATAAATTAKVVSLSNFELYTGATITVRFQYGNTSASPTLNVNGTGAKSVVVNSSSTPVADLVKWGAYATCMFTYDGTYWRFVASDQDVVRVSSAETAIEQNSEAIALRATKTEAYQSAQPNLTPWFSIDTSDLYSSATNPNGYWGATSNLYGAMTKLDDGWEHFEFDNGSGTNPVYFNYAPRPSAQIKTDAKYTFLVEVRNLSVSGSGTFSIHATSNNADVMKGQFANSKNVLFNSSSQASSSIHLVATSRSSFDGCETLSRSFSGVQAGVSVSCDFRISLYEGEYTGPYKPYSGKQLYASQAELRVANDAISARVEKDGVISAINLTSETAKIQASRVEIDGTAVFNAISSNVEDTIEGYGYATASSVPTKVSDLTNDSGFQTSSQVDTAITSKGYATTTQVADAIDGISVGGRNLILGTAVEKTSDASASNSAYTSDYTLSDYGHSIMDNVDDTWYCSFDFAISGNSADNVNIYFQFRGSATTVDLDPNASGNASGHIGKAFKLSSTQAASTAKTCRIRMQNASDGATFTVTKLKLAKATNPSDWTPAPEDQTAAMRAVYGTCSTAAGTAAKVVTCDSFELYTGANLTVKFTTANTAGAPTLTVNGAGPYPVWNNNNVASTSNPVLWGANATLHFTFDGEHWVLTDKPPAYLAGSSTAAGTRAKAATVTGALVVNGTTITVTFSTANTYVANSVQLNLSSTGATAIYVDRVATSSSHTLLWDANTALTFVRNSTGWHLISGREKGSVEVTQRLYYRTTTEASSLTGPTTWVTQNGNVYDAWTTKVPPLSTTTDSSETGFTKYLYLYTCEQRRRMDGSIVCTPVTLDENTTVVDGGNIITHTITAEQLNATSINASEILTVGAFTDADRASISNENVVVGGRNLLRNSAAFDPDKEPFANSNVTAYTTSYGGELSWYCSGSKWVRVDFPTLDSGEEYTLSFSATRADARYVYVTIGDTTSNVGKTSSTLGAWTRFSHTFTAGADAYARIRVYTATDSGTATYVAAFKEFKLERYDHATDWTPAPEDQTAYVDGVSDSLSSRIEDLLAAAEAIDGRTQAFELSETDGLTIASKAEGGTADFNINIKGEGMQFRYQKQVLATASTSGFDAPHLGAGTDLTIGTHWRWQQDKDGRLVLVYVS